MALGIEQAMTRHQVQLQRLAGGNYRKVLPILQQMSKDLRSMILTDLNTESLKSVKAVQKETTKIVNKAVLEMGKDLAPEFKELAIYEANFVNSIYTAAVIVDLNAVKIKEIEAALKGSKMLLYDRYGKAQALTIQEAFKQFDETVIKEVGQKVLGGIGEGQTSRQIATDVFRMTNGRTRNQAEALVRTSTNHVASVSRETFYKQNDEVIKGERYTATLDNRTSMFCITHDGILYDIGKGPQTPAHWNCRSMRIAEVYDKYKIPGLAETRSAIDGPVSDKVTYGDFLKKQDVDFQNDVLGKARADLFRSGDVKIGQFTDFGRVLTIKELEAKYQ